MPATQQYIFPWIATARDNSVGTLPPGTVYDEATRTSHVCFMKGLKENIEITTNDGLPWQWRRICFTMKGGVLAQNFDTTTQQLYAETNTGWKRVVNSAYGSAAVGGIQSLIFRGSAGVDWSNIMTAPIETNNITIKYDRYHNIKAGNDSGTIRNYKLYHPMNKNLNYDDDEEGGKETTRNVSTAGKPGMGDYYVIDIFQPRIGGTSSSVLRFEPTATLYWHEK